MTGIQSKITVNRKRFRWARFSLLSLLLLSMTICSGVLLSKKRDAWQPHSIFPDFPRQVKTAYISPDGSRVATLMEGQAYSFEFDEKLTPGIKLKEIEGDGRLNRIQLWNLKDQSLIHTFDGGYPEHLGTGGGATMSWSPQGRWMHMQSHDGILHWERVWDTTTGRELPLLNNERNTGYESCRQFSADDRYIVYSSDNKLRSYDAKNETHTYIAVGARACRLSNGYLLAVYNSNDQMLTLWDLREGRALWQEDIEVLRRNHLPPKGLRTIHVYVTLAFSPDSKVLAFSLHSPAETYLIDVSNRQLLHSIPGALVQRSTYLSVVQNQRSSFSPDGLSILIRDSKDGLSVWNTLTGKQRFRLPSRGASDNWAFSADGSKLVSEESNDQAWDALTGNPMDLLQSDKRWIHFQSFVADGKTAVLPLEKNVRIINQVRPEAWYGVFWIPLFWTTLLLFIALIWSVRRDVLHFQKT